MAVCEWQAGNLHRQAKQSTGVGVSPFFVSIFQICDTTAGMEAGGACIAAPVAASLMMAHCGLNTLVVRDCGPNKGMRRHV